VRKLPGVSVSFFYCKYQDTEHNTFLAVARGILSQLLHQDDTLLPYLYEKASKSGQTVLKSNALAKELLTTSVKNRKRLYVVLDGIDEWDREDRKEIVSILEEISESFPPDDADSFRCMFVSQDDSLARKDFSKMVSLKITESDVKKDIQTYATVWSAKIQSKSELTAERQNFVADSITAKAEGKPCCQTF
jgi:Cdc6-like AAA superfamily ATPase